MNITNCKLNKLLESLYEITQKEKKKKKKEQKCPEDCLKKIYLLKILILILLTMKIIKII